MWIHTFKMIEHDVSALVCSTEKLFVFSVFSGLLLHFSVRNGELCPLLVI